MKKLRAQLTYANVVSTLALIVAIAGGTTAIAASVGKNSVTSKSIKDGNVTAKDLARITMVEAAEIPGGPGGATCPKGQRLIGGGGSSGNTLTASVPSDQGADERTAEAWLAGGTPPSRAIALCLAAKPSKQKD